jgi:hypothetical protein
MAAAVKKQLGFGKMLAAGINLAYNKVHHIAL